jgi:hypothetical protein
MASNLTCATCAETRDIELFINSKNMLSRNCRKCRLAYVDKKNLEHGMKYCGACRKTQPIVSFTKEGKVYPSCSGCRFEWYKKQQVDLSDKPTEAVKTV